jgi:hypothetical protein
LLLQRLPHVLTHPSQAWPTPGVVAHPNDKRVALFVEADQFPRLCLDLDALEASGFGGKRGKREQQEGKRQQQLAVDMSQRASWDEAWKRYAAGSIMRRASITVRDHKNHYILNWISDITYGKIKNKNQRKF